MNDTLTKLRDSFEDLQTQETNREQARQHKDFRAAHKYLTRAVGAQHDEQEAMIEGVVGDKLDDLCQLHTIENENLDLELELTKKPRIKVASRRRRLSRSSRWFDSIRFDRTTTDDDRTTTPNGVAPRAVG